MPHCKSCKACKHENANYCKHMIMSGLMPDGTSRLSCRGKPLFTMSNCATFSEYTVMMEMSLCKINETAPLDKVCLLGCGVTTGYGAAVNVANVKPGSTCAVWGLGALGLSAIMGCRNSEASRIYAIDINPSKFDIAKEFGATDFINPSDLVDTTIQEYLMKLTDGDGLDYTFECTGNTEVLKQALESSAVAYGVCILIGVAPAGQEFKFQPWDFLTGRTLRGTTFGHYKGNDVPKLVELYLNGKLNFEKMITHQKSLEDINETFDLLKAGKSIRAVINL